MNDLPLHTIPRGALVFDRLGRPVGNVDYVQTPDVRRANDFVRDDHEVNNRQGIWDFAEDILELVFQGDDQFSDDLVARIENGGYLHVIKPDGSGVFVFWDQVAHEEDGAIFLNMEAHDLLSHQPSTAR